MSWDQIDPEIRLFILEHTTVNQLAVIYLEADGHSQRVIAATLGISRRAVQERLDAAHQRLTAAGLRQDKTGRFTIEEAA